MRRSRKSVGNERPTAAMLVSELRHDEAGTLRRSSAGAASVTMPARVTEMFGLLRVAGYQKKGTQVRSQQPKAVQKRKERAEGRKDRGKPRKASRKSRSRIFERRCTRSSCTS
jgi:hypothetical protein